MSLVARHFLALRKSCSFSESATPNNRHTKRLKNVASSYMHDFYTHIQSVGFNPNLLSRQFVRYCIISKQKKHIHYAKLA